MYNSNFTLFRKVLFFEVLFVNLFFSCTPDSNTLFQELPPSQTGVRFKNILRETEAFNVMTYGYFYNGGGVAVGDVNNDGLPDIYFTGNLVASHLYLNEGDMNFQDVAKEAGVEAAGLWNTGVTMADVNGDGWLDIYVCRSAATMEEKRMNLLFINEGLNEAGIPTFSEQAQLYGISDPGYTTQAAFFDYDRDGDLDLYVLNHSVPEFGGFSKTLARYKQQSNPLFGDKLYENIGPLKENGKAGGFTDVTRYSGILTNVLGFGLGVGISDVNLDGWPDIYVSNDYNEQDYLYINQQNKTFKESLADQINHSSLFSMGNDIADINNDGLPDIFTLDMLPEGNYREKLSVGTDNYDKHQLLNQGGFYHQYMRNMLHLNLGNGAFSEIGQVAGIAQTDWSWAALFADYDNDGWKDLFISNGYKADYTNMDFLAYSADAQIQSQRTKQEVALSDLMQKVPSIEVPNYIYQNQGNLTFADKTTEWGMDKILLSNGAAYADLDQDGDLDLIINNVNTPASIFENRSERFASNNYLSVRLEGRGRNTQGIGAKCILTVGERSYMQELMPTRGFQSAVEPLLHFGLGKDTVVDKLEIYWPDSSYQVLENVKSSQLLTLSQAPSRKPKAKNAQSPFFTVGPAIDFTHRENAFVDFKREPLLPRMLSTQGPKLATGDINGDGLEDVFIGGAKGQAGKLFIQSKPSTFQAYEFGLLEEDAPFEDMGATITDLNGDGRKDLYVVSGGAEVEPLSPLLQDRLYLNKGGGKWERSKGLPKMLSSGSCVRPVDIDKDGDRDLFVGGRLSPGNYPAIPQSYLLENKGQGKFDIVTDQWAAGLSQVGMVCDAQWADLNLDGKADLVVVGEWMHPSVWIHGGESLENRSEAWGMFGYSGGWNSLHAADLDGDGDTDLVVGNEGLNTAFRASAQEPLSLYVNDFDGNGKREPIMTYYERGSQYPLAYRDDLLSQLSPLKKQFPDYASYASATLAEIFREEALRAADTLLISCQESIWFENTGNSFVKHSLPLEAQFAPMYAIESLDLNFDGHLDLILGGNFSSTRVQFGRTDANWGQVLLGDGKRDFQGVNQQLAGLRIRGDVRDMALVETSQGKLLLVAVNDGTLRSYWVKGDQ